LFIFFKLDTKIRLSIDDKLTLVYEIDILLLRSQEGKARGIKCPKCQHENPDNFSSNKYPRTAFSMGKAAMKCPKCNTKNPDDSKFCKECATPLPGVGEAVSTKTLQTPIRGFSKGTIVAGRYEVILELGRGGMGVVYKAKDTKLKRNVALKFLPTESMQDKQAKARFLQEAQAAAALNHPNICIIHEIDAADDQTFIAMEFIEGQTLKKRIEEGPLKFEEAIEITTKVAEGLKQAHERGIIHRDIKPANIMLTDKDKVKILDFGIAKLSGLRQLTHTGTTIGTMAYMSPEQARGEKVDPRTDIWSLGAILYEMLAGCPPFQGDHESARMYSILNEEPRDIKKLCPGCPSVVTDVISSCLQKKAENRFASMQEVLDILERKIQSKKLAAPQRKHNLPEQLTSFIGRSQEIATIQKLLSKNRLVTLTGAGGCGKTRLAGEVAANFIEEYEDGVWFINLGPVTDPNFVAMEISEVLNIKEEPKKAIIDTLIENIKNMSLLILLDNCEHLVQSCAEIADKLLQSVKGLRILATSREALNTRGEVPWRVPSLSFPDKVSKTEIDEALQYEAVKLFTERAASSQSGFTLNPQNTSFVIRICQRLAGIPLAIELAATRIRHLGPEAILDRLEDQFKILTSSSRTTPERQQTLKATIDWSYDLLSEKEQLLFSRLSVFTGDFSLEAVEDVCEDDLLNKDDILSLLSQLVDKSLVNTEHQEDESVRYSYLMPLHQYSLHKLVESGEEEKYRKRHLSYYLNMVEQAYKEQFESQLKWLNELELEHENLIAALNWSSTECNEDFILLAGYMGWFWYLHGHILLGIDFLEKALSKDTEKSEAYARISAELGRLLWYTANTSRALKMMTESLDFWRQHKNLWEQAIVLSLLGKYGIFFKDDEIRLKYNEEGLRVAKQVGDPALANNCLADFCQSLICLHKFDQAKPFVEELVVSSEKLEQPWEIVLSHHFRGDCALGTGNFKEAEKEYAHAVTSALKYGNTLYVAVDFQGVAFAVSGQSRWAKAIRIDAAAQKIYNQIGVKIEGGAVFWDKFIATFIEGAKKKVGEELTRKYEEEGRKMELEAAVEYALDFDKD
jgi:predicted ATPase/tRNA A-37 threonylcarbamoyl transferase component Bud32